MAERLRADELGAGRDALVITGPTATGKTALSLAIASRLDGEIISMDSRQVYREMEIGTAKATRDERSLIPHHGLDIIDPDERYSAGRFARDTHRWIEEIRARHRLPILVGGTGFFLLALTRPLFTEPELDPERRERLTRYLESKSLSSLHGLLARLDPDTATRLQEGGGRQRLIRAIEVALLTGRSLSWWHRNAPPELPPLRPLTFVLNLPRAELYRRINERVTAMLESGLVEEVERLLESGYHPTDPGLSGTGYPEIIAYLDGELTLDEAADAIRRATRRYARRQLTWARNQLQDAIWLDATSPLESLVETIVHYWTEEAP